jgi:enoyl-CoA hydratase/carnithine racemase
MSDLLVDRRDRVTLFTLNRPAKLNALTRAMIADLRGAIEEFERDPAQRVAVITGAGERAFSAGADLVELAVDVGSGARTPISRVPDIAGVAAAGKPVIAAVNGLAVAAGLELALCCDIRIAAADAWFGAFEVRRGLVAGVAVARLAGLVPLGDAMDLLLSGERMPAADALRAGLVRQVVARERLLDTALAKAAAIAEGSPAAVRATKAVLRFGAEAGLAERQRYYEAACERLRTSGDMAEGTRAFVEKRPPRFADGP